MSDFHKQFVLALLAYGVQRNIDPGRLCELSGINYKSLPQNTRSTITDAQINSLWKNASNLSNDPLFGLHFGESMQLAALGAIGQIVQTSATVGEALTNACALTHLITDMFEMKVIHARKSFRVSIVFDAGKADRYPFYFRHMADYLMVFVVHELNGLLLQKVAPSTAKFPYSVSDTTEYHRIFACRISAIKNELSLEFPITLLHQQILSADYELQNHLLKKVAVLKKNNSDKRSMHTKVYNYLLANSYLHVLSLEEIAANFNLSTRSLQRRLKDEDTTYFQIVEEVRKKLATSYLSAASYSVKDISNMLGYNEQSAFVRAFKRWTNKTPSEFSRKV